LKLSGALLKSVGRSQLKRVFDRQTRGMVVEERVQVQPEPLAPGIGFLARLSGFAADGLHYWEPRRLIYNGTLALVISLHFVLAWPGSRAKLSVDLALGIFILAVLANVAHSAAYIPDLFVQFAGVKAAWRWGRVVLLTVGTMFAATITHFFAKGMFGK
jgi:hypothetical protein